MEITMRDAQRYIQAREYGALTPEAVRAFLSPLKGATFAELVQVTDVTLAALHKNESIVKVSVANVQLFNNLKDFTNVYVNAVKRTAEKLGLDNQKNIDNFESQGNYFEHTDCYSLCKHKTEDKYYLFLIYNRASSVYVKDGLILPKEDVAHYLTPAAARKLMEPEAVNYNKANDVHHTVQLRVVSLSNIVSVHALHEELLA